MAYQDIKGYIGNIERKLMKGKLSKNKYMRLMNQLTLWEVNCYQVEVFGEKPFIDDFSENDDYWNLDEDEFYDEDEF